jgi:hypothetical protein
MPLKYNLTKYDTMNSEVHKLSGRFGAETSKNMDELDNTLLFKAILIASFSSGHSWQTHKCLVSETQKLKSPEVKEEYREAVTNKWKNITPFDIKEIADMKISDTTFAEWLFFNVDKAQYQSCKRAWTELKKEFGNDCDTNALRVGSR